jgi:hypothetical protein
MYEYYQYYQRMPRKLFVPEGISSSTSFTMPLTNQVNGVQAASINNISLPLSQYSIISVKTPEGTVGSESVRFGASNQLAG